MLAQQELVLDVSRIRRESDIYIFSTPYLLSTEPILVCKIARFVVKLVYKIRKRQTTQHVEYRFIIGGPSWAQDRPFRNGPVDRFREGPACGGSLCATS